MASDIAYVDRGKERWWDERKDEKVFFRDIVERMDTETPESGEKNGVFVGDMQSDGDIDVARDSFFERIKMYVSYAAGIRLEYFQVHWKDNTRGCLNE